MFDDSGSQNSTNADCRDLEGRVRITNKLLIYLFSCVAQILVDVDWSIRLLYSYFWLPTKY